MKLFTALLVSTALVVGAAAPVQADSLLGGLIGGKDDKALITLGSGDAGTSGLVNLGLGGENQILDLKVGNGDIGSATVGSGGASGILDADVRLLNDNARVGVGVGGDRLLDVDVGVGSPGGGNNGGGNNGGGNNGGGNNGGGNNGGGNNGGNGVGVASTGSGGDSCAGLSASEIERLLRATRLDGSWSRASNVQIRPVSICPEQRSWLAAALVSTNLGPSLKSAIAADALLAASISRSPYSADRVFAVQQSGGQLTMFVY